MKNSSQMPVQNQIEEYLRYCEFTRRQSKMTLSGKRHTLKHLIFATKITDIRKFTNQDFDQWLEYMDKRGVSARTINTRMAHIIKFVKYFKEMYSWEIAIKLPMIKKLKEGKTRRVAYSCEQIEKVLKLSDAMTRLLIKICFDAGLRISELRNLKLENFHGRRINFIGKGSKDRESYITEKTRQELDAWICDNDITDFLWINENGRQYSVDQLRIKMRQAFSAAGFYDFYPHALRHSFGTNLQRKGASLMEMQMMLGHSNAETTQRYLHGLDGKLGSLFEKYQRDETNFASVNQPKNDNFQEILAELLREIRKISENQAK